MKPVLVLQHLHSDDPAYLGQWLQAQCVLFEVFNTEAGQPFPDRIAGFSALAILGGEMSANDPLPSLRRAESLIRQAVEAGVPTLGHCLGGQLMARALGAVVRASPAIEIGWQKVHVNDSADALAWFGCSGPQMLFEWHGEAFDLPRGATLLASSPACPHQAFAHGPHLAMQFHVEVDAAKLHAWTEDDALPDGGLPLSASVQSVCQMRHGRALYLAAQQRLAGRIYQRWIELAAAMNRP